MTTTRSYPSRLFFFLCFLGLFGNGLAGQMALNWSDDVAGEPPSPRSDGVYFYPIGKIEARILDATTEPKSPLGGEKVGLAVERASGADESARFRIQIKPFWNRRAPKVGWLECEMVLNGNDNYITLFNSGLPNSPLERNAPTGQKILETILGVDNKPLFITLDGEERKKRHGDATFTHGQPFTLKIKWDFESAAPNIMVTVDGEIVMDWNRDFPGVPLENPCDLFTISLRSGVIGNVVVSE